VKGQILQTIVFATLVTMFFAIALRILLRAWTSRALPDWLIGGFFLGIGGMLLCRGGSTMLLEQDAELSGRLFHLGNASFVLADVILCFFTWIVFRRHAVWARNLALSTVLLLLGILAARFTFGEASEILVVLSVVRLVPCAWAFVETTLYYRNMRKRSRVGLGKPVVANRFLLWSIWTGAMASLPLFVMVTRIAAALSGNDDPWASLQSGEPVPLVQAALGLIAVSGVAAISALWLSFFPPAAYTQWIGRRGAIAGV
jgi:hypothetical protein